MSKPETTVTVLHAVEDATAQAASYGSAGVIVADIAKVTGLSETTVRKQLKELEDGGFVDQNGADGRNRRYRAVRKQEPDTPKTNGSRGRPRTPEAEGRDEAVLNLIKRGVSKVDDIAKQLDTTHGLAYLSVWRLVKAGAVKKEATGTRSPNYVPA